MTIGSFLKKKRINEYIEKYNMIHRGDGIILGLSGGPDSVCLFFVLLALAADYDLSIKAVHVNHMIRGVDADEDEEYVRQLCADYQVPLDVRKFDIPKMAKESGRSMEEEARMARYDAFEKAAMEMEKDGRSAKIAIAHNADDNAETVIFHMARGAGLDGMCGISPVRDRIIRPLLAVKKQEILDFLEENGIPYCIDATNAETDYDRNRIRHNILPELNKVNEKAVEHISEMTARLAEVSEFLSMETSGLLQMAQLENNKLRKRTIATAPRVVAAQALKDYISNYMPQKKDVAAVHIEAILGLLNADGERQIQLPYQKTLIISYEEIYVIEDEVNSTNLNFSYREFDFKPGMEYPKEIYTKWFDCDKIGANVVVRTRSAGDYLCIDSQGNRKLIQDYFVDEKIPKHLRDQVPLVCDGQHVMWVVGHRISEYYKITDDTTRVLEISCMEE